MMQFESDPNSDRFEKVDEIFDAAIDLPAGEQTAFVQRASGGDDALRDDVLELLRAYHRSDGVLDTPAAHLAAPMLDVTTMTAALPDHIGSFRIVREIGRGGMGRVLLGERADGHFEQRVAIKVMQHATPGIVRRFVEERRILALLEHPNIARLVDGGIAQGGLPYFAMELVDGEPIDRYCDRNALSIDRRLDLFASVCDAVNYAHQHLVIHRDLKPSNILVTVGGQVKLLDFGIAKLLDASTGDDMTRTELEAMTPEFASPEQIRRSPISTTTDVYSLGVLLYILLTGQRPYDLKGKSPGEVERIVCVDEPVKPSAKAPAAVAKQLRGDLDLIVMTALHKQPERRYASPAALALDLQRFREGRAIQARPDSRRYRLGKFVRRNRTGVAFATASAIALVAATGFSVVQMQKARAEQSEAMRQARHAMAMSEVQVLFAGDSRDADGRPLSASGRIDAAERIVMKRFASDPWLVSLILTDLSGRHLEAGDVQAQRAMLGRARAIARDANALPELALADCVRATSFWLDDTLDSARTDVDEAKAAIVRFPRRDPDVEMHCLEAEGKLLQATGQPDSGIALMKRALAIADSQPPGDLQMSMTNALAEVLRLSGRTREAVPYFKRILSDLDRLGYGDTESFPNVVGFLWLSLIDLGEFATLDSTLGVYIRDRESRLGAGRIPTQLAFMYGATKVRLGALDSADLWIARSMRDTTQGANSFALYLAPTLVDLRLGQGRVAEAKRLVPRLPDVRRGQHATATMLRTRLRWTEGDRKGAATTLEQTLDTLMNDGKDRLTMFALPLVTAGEWRLMTGDARGADSLAQLAATAAAIDSLAVTRSALSGQAELLRARALAALGDAANARAAATRAVTALGNGYGGSHPLTRKARQLADSMKR